MRTLDLAGRKALVTGGNRGLGLAVAQALAKAGAAVTITARSESGLTEALGTLEGAGAVEGRLADVTDHGAMAAVLAEGFDVLVNNAGVIEPIGLLGDTAIGDWAWNLEVNLFAAVHAIQRALPAMLARGGGTVVNISSGAAHRPMEGWSAYCAGKAALAMVTRSLHEEYGGRGIRAFGLAPGLVDTGMQATIRASGVNPVSQVPRENLASPDEPAWAVAWLCTAAADPLTGQDLDVRHDAFRRAAGLEVRG